MFCVVYYFFEFFLSAVGVENDDHDENGLLCYEL
jgi:hypothetical protein